MKVRYEATIPTGTYANIRPVVEFDDVKFNSQEERDEYMNECFENALDHFIHIALTCSDNPSSVSRNKIKKA